MVHVTDDKLLYSIYAVEFKNRTNITNTTIQKRTVYSVPGLPVGLSG
jgi:hypothetical protein